jgi:hypothetical protein
VALHCALDGEHWPLGHAAGVVLPHGKQSHFVTGAGVGGAGAGVGGAGEGGGVGTAGPVQCGTPPLQSSTPGGSGHANLLLGTERSCRAQ